MTAWRSVLLIFILLGLSPGCRGNDAKPPAPPAAPTLDLVKTATLTTDAEGGSARPEIVAAADRVYAVYLGHIGNMNTKTFDVEIYDRDLARQLSSATIAPPSVGYGTATDIRIARDDQEIFTFSRRHDDNFLSTRRKVCLERYV